MMSREDFLHPYGDAVDALPVTPEPTVARVGQNIRGTADNAASWPRSTARVAGWIATAIATFLVPWAVLLAATLPASYHAQHWRLVWAGLDGAEALAAALTGPLLRRGDVRAALTATAGATLVLVDAWFDVTTSAGGLDRLLAIIEAVFVELPVGAGAIWLAVVVIRTQTAGTRLAPAGSTSWAAEDGPIGESIRADPQQGDR